MHEYTSRALDDRQNGRVSVIDERVASSDVSDNRLSTTVSTAEVNSARAVVSVCYSDHGCLFSLSATYSRNPVVLTLPWYMHTIQCI